MYKNAIPLSEQERNFAAEHHDEIIYKFLRQKGLSVNEYYDVVILDYLYAVRVYLDRPDLREQYSFECVARKKMQSAVYKYWHYGSRPKRCAITISLESAPDAFNPVDLSCAMDQVEARDQWDRVRPHITIKEMEALTLKTQGYSYREIAELVGLKSPSSVGSRIQRMRHRIQSALLIERLCAMVRS